MNFDFRAAPGTPLSLAASLLEIETAQLIRRAEDLEPTYIFKHALVQDSAGASLLKSELKRLHLLVAHAYETTYADRCMDEFAALLAQHYGEAGDDAKTLTYAIHAGDVAASEYANVEAIAFYTQALDVARRAGATTAQFIHLYTKRGRVHEVQGNYERALSEYQELLALAQARNDRALELGALMLQTTLRCGPMPTFEPTLGRQLAEQALALANALNDRAAETKVLWHLQLLSLNTGQQERAIEYGERALAIAQELKANGQDMREQIAYILNDLTVPYALTKSITRGMEANAQARELWRALDNRTMLADNLGSYGQFLYALGEFERAIEISAEGAAIASSIGNNFGMMFNKSYGAGCYFELGEMAAAWREGNEAIRIGKGLGGVIQVVGPANFALMAATLGNLELSREFDRRARTGFVEHMPHFFFSVAYAVLARATVLRGEWAQAADDIAASRALTTSNMQAALLAQLAIAEARLALAHHEPTRAIETAETYIKIQQDGSYRFMLAELLYLRALALRELKQDDAAWDSLQQARDVAQVIHQRRMLWQIYALLSEIENDRGNTEQANAYQEQAREVIEYIVERTPIEFRESFLNLPNVRVVTNSFVAEANE